MHIYICTYTYVLLYHECSDFSKIYVCVYGITLNILWQCEGNDGWSVFRSEGDKTSQKTMCLMVMRSTYIATKGFTTSQTQRDFYLAAPRKIKSFITDLAAFKMPLKFQSAFLMYIRTYGTDLTQHRTRKWHALESNPLSTKISSIHHWMRVDAFVKYVWRKHLQHALIEYLISNVISAVQRREI